MSEPTSRFRLIPQSTPTGSIDSTAERLAAISGQSVITTGAGNEADFGVVNISDGAENSGVLTMLWDITAHGGNTSAELFKLWCSSNGFDMGGSVVKVQPLCGGDGTPVLTEEYVASGVVGSYTWATMVEAEPGAINLWPSDEGSSITLNPTEDAVMWAMYLAIADNETTGTYKGTDAGFQLQFSFKFSYS